MKVKRTIGDVLVYVFVTAVAILSVFPIVFIITGAFKTNSELLTRPELLMPQEWYTGNFVKAWNSESIKIVRMVLNSILYTACSVAITLTTSTMAGYAFARGNFKFKNQIFAAFVSLMFISVGSITIYPQFEILNLLHLNRGLPALLVMHFFGIPIANIFLVRNYIGGIPIEIDEAATIDGCGFIGRFVKIIAPLLKPLFATLGILAFQSSWNDYLMPNIFTLTVPEQRTLIVGIMALKTNEGGGSDWALMFAASVLALIPVLIAYTFANKYFVDGLANGAVKG